MAREMKDCVGAFRFEFQEVALPDGQLVAVEAVLYVKQGEVEWFKLLSITADEEQLWFEGDVPEDMYEVMCAALGQHLEPRWMRALDGVVCQDKNIYRG
jgi:hypothetical protein